MKPVRKFNIGDKVFAKVKGYPSWPAIITADHRTKYNVRFYGTGETGVVGVKDLSYYLKNKEKFVKSSKRKDFRDAVVEIEKEIAEAGTDGDTEENNDTSVEKTVKNNSTGGIAKRKRSSSGSSDSAVKKKVIDRKTPRRNEDAIIEDFQANLSPSPDNEVSLTNTSTSSELQSIVEDTPNTEEPDLTTKLLDVTIKKTTEEDVEKEEAESEQDTVIEVSKIEDINVLNDKPALTIDDIKIFTENYLGALVDYADHVRKNEAFFKKTIVNTIVSMGDISNIKLPGGEKTGPKKKSVEQRSHLENAVVIAKIPNGKYIGVKYNQELQPQISNEYEYAMHDESVGKSVLSLKTRVEQGTYNPVDEPELFCLNLDIDEYQLNNAIEVDLIRRKKEKLSWLRTEASLVELDKQIKDCLGLDKAQPKEGAKGLEEMLKLDVQPLMLKKHPNVVDMVKRLRRYIGNVKNWNMTDDECVAFETDARTIREKAYDVYMKFAKLFCVQDEMLFWEIFSLEVEEFKEEIMDIPESAVFVLSSEPNSRQTFLNMLDEVEEMKTIVAKLDKRTKTKNNEKKDSNNSKNSSDLTEDSNALQTS